MVLLFPIRAYGTELIEDRNRYNPARRYINGARVDDRAAMIDYQASVHSISYFHKDRLGTVIACGVNASFANIA